MKNHILFTFTLDTIVLFVLKVSRVFFFFFLSVPLGLYILLSHTAMESELYLGTCEMRSVSELKEKLL